MVEIKKARKVWVPKASQNLKPKDHVHTSFINMVWVPKVGQIIKPKDDVQTSSITTTCHTSVAHRV
jgi:hypothetical protein